MKAPSADAILKSYLEHRDFLLDRIYFQFEGEGRKNIN